MQVHVAAFSLVEQRRPADDRSGAAEDVRAHMEVAQVEVVSFSRVEDWLEDRQDRGAGVAQQAVEDGGHEAPHEVLQERQAGFHVTVESNRTERRERLVADLRV